MIRFLIVLTVWLICVMAAVKLAVRLHKKDRQHTDWEPGFFTAVKEKLSSLYKRMKGIINAKKLSKLRKTKGKK